ncbi:putative disease resistance protein RGA4 [Miscanthus floridulus]|uniref:putative disease resistance protein RGA4 n=1 Tax=Miscanthus floridulus TaxID=154761 RepID=UPI0034589046
MDSMADMMRKLGWIAWCLTVVGWFLSPIISLLVNKIFVYLVFNTSKKLKELENETIPKLKQTLGVVEEQTMLRAAEDKGSQSNLKILDSMKKDLMSALYEAEDILDLLDYRRIEKDLHLGDDDSRWVENQLGAACAWIARCKGSSFGRWIHVTLAAVMKRAQSMTQQGQFLIQGWRHSRQNFDLFCMCRDIKIAGAAVLQCAQSWYQQLEQLFRCIILRRSGALLPVSRLAPQPPCLESRGSVFVPVEPTRRPAEEMVDDEEIVEETQVVEGEAAEGIQDGEDGAMSEKIEEESSEGGEVGETSFEEEIEEDDVERKEGEPTSLSIFQYCARPMLTLFAKLCFYRDWPYGIVGIKSKKEDGSAAELVPITERISLRNRIKHIEDILTALKKSDMLNDTNSSSGTTTDADNESSSFTVKNTAKESRSNLKEIDKLYINIDKIVFGRDKDRADIIRMLREGPDTYAASSSTSKPYSVIGIYGITGSGKSTLAQYVCDHEKYAGHFNLIMFVLVGKTFSMDLIFRDMLEQITQSRPSKDNDLESLKAELKKELKDKCFLLVLDDVWVNGDNMKERRILLDVLLVGQSGSRILVTAQKTDAAAALGAQEKMQIPIPDLEEEQYLSMFMHYALEDSQVTGNDYERYKAVGRKITKKLRRSPIAAITVAARLKSESRIDFWERTSNLDVLDETMGALWWSYQQLGVDIRRCFTYCSIFPKAYTLRRDEIVDLWIAQGFVNTRRNGTEELEDIGYSYFDELQTFSFLQVRRRTILGEAVDFTIHDLLHELAERVSGSEFYRIVSNGSPKEIPRGVHHLFIETNNGSEIVEKILDMGNLRTLIIQEPRGTMRKYHDLVKVTDRLFMSLRKLRVLIVKLRHCRNELSVPVSIYQMKHLRYLRVAFIVGHLILPSTFSKLYHIQTIDIPCFRASCPENMANLIYLRHISASLSFPNIGRLTSLQTMGSFSVKEAQGYELKQLMHLNKLRGNLSIWGLEVVGSKEEALEAYLCNKERLRELKLTFGWGNRVGPDMEAEVLEGLCPPKDLQELTILRYNGSRYPSWVLSGHHPDAPKHLHKLELYECSQLAAIPEDSELFIGLRKLCIYCCDWDRLPENMACLVSLQSLWIWDCDKIELLPTLPHQALKTIHIQGCPVLSRTCKEEGHPNWDMIQHISEQYICL